MCSTGIGIFSALAAKSAVTSVVMSAAEKSEFAKFGFERFAFGFTAAGNDEMRAAVREGQCRLTADACKRTGNHNNWAVHFRISNDLDERCGAKAGISPVGFAGRPLRRCLIANLVVDCEKEKDFVGWRACL